MSGTIIKMNFFQKKFLHAFQRTCKKFYLGEVYSKYIQGESYTIIIYAFHILVIIVNGNATWTNLYRKFYDDEQTCL